MTQELGRLSSAVHRALDEASVSREPAGELALTYAARIDLDTDELKALGPLLLAALVELGLTPKARAALVKGGPSGPVSSPLDELRERRAARQRHAQALDA